MTLKNAIFIRRRQGRPLTERRRDGDNSDPSMDQSIIHQFVCILWLDESELARNFNSISNGIITDSSLHSSGGFGFFMQIPGTHLNNSIGKEEGAVAARSCVTTSSQRWVCGQSRIINTRTPPRRPFVISGGIRGSKQATSWWDTFTRHHSAMSDSTSFAIGDLCTSVLARAFQLSNEEHSEWVVRPRNGSSQKLLDVFLLCMCPDAAWPTFVGVVRWIDDVGTPSLCVNLTVITSHYVTLSSGEECTGADGRKEVQPSDQQRRQKVSSWRSLKKEPVELMFKLHEKGRGSGRIQL